MPRVESLLTFDYDISGRFSDPYIIGGATFARSQFLGATVGAEDPTLAGDAIGPTTP